MIARWTAWFRRLRRRFSRSEWGVYLLGLPRVPDASTSPGLLLIQIDGLPRRQLEKGLDDGRLPHLRRLRDREGYRLHTFYSGLPSSTPGVQGELFYGVHCAVPAFSFCDRESGILARMYEQSSASRVEQRLRGQNPGLLEGGSSYTNIYAGGADESHFCAATIGWGNLMHRRNPLRWASVLIWHTPTLLRIAALTMLELGLAVTDMVRGIWSGQHVDKELKFVPSRVAVAILLRELAVIGASMDMARGLPIIHINFLGYDEHAHRRGPTSRFAYWALKGIDGAVRRLWSEARRSPARDYDVWVFSDHGQEWVVPYPTATGKTIQQAVEDAVNAVRQSPHQSRSQVHSVQLTRAHWLGQGPLAKLLRWCPGMDALERGEGTIVAAMGPIAHVYPDTDLTPEQVEAVARRLAEQEQVPIVLYVASDRRVMAMTRRGNYDLREQPGEVLGADHPLLADVATDLEHLVRHVDAGTLVLSGWRTDGPPLSFAVENGAHAGPGTEETRGFALLPCDAPLPSTERAYLRAIDLRHGALHLLGRDTPPSYAPRERPAPVARRLRIMTYNVHSCVGMDGRLSPTRIARVITQSGADVVALQELDSGRVRSDFVDQAHAIAHELEMDFHFHPALRIEEELYGDAVLSRVPMRLVHAGPLTRPKGRDRLEMRGALWVELDVDGQPLQLINTHLGLGRLERMLQVQDLLGPHWLDHPRCCKPLILCGDFNAVPRSPSYSLLAQRLTDAQTLLNGHRPLATWVSGSPINRIDHVFVSEGVKVRRVEVPRTELVCVASDHLPLIVEVEIE